MIRRILILAITIFTLLLPSLAVSLPATGTIDVFFSPNGGCTDAIIREINIAKTEVLIQAYSFTSVPIAKAVIAAKRRGVKIEAILDKSQRSGKYSAATFLTNAGVSVLIDDRHAIAHNKIIIIDRNTLITGSFNFTKAAEEKNAENILILKENHQLTNEYLEEFYQHKKHSRL